VIYRAFRATSSAALDVESHLLPIAQQIEKQNTHTLSRIMSYQAVLELGNILRVGPATHAYLHILAYYAVLIDDTKTRTLQTSTL
jgi:hypothetical protein